MRFSLLGEIDFAMKHSLNTDFSDCTVFCRTNHKLRKSILVEFEFFTSKWIKTVFLFLSKFGVKLPLLSKVEQIKSMPIQK